MTQCLFTDLKVSALFSCRFLLDALIIPLYFGTAPLSRCFDLATISMSWNYPLAHLDWTSKIFHIINLPGIHTYAGLSDPDHWFSFLLGLLWLVRGAVVVIKYRFSFLQRFTTIAGIDNTINQRMDRYQQCSNNRIY